MEMALCNGAGCLHVVSYIFSILVLGNVLIPAQNVTLSSKNFSLFLTWTPPEVHPPQSIYSMEIMPENVWIEPANCKFPSEKICDITCTIKNCYSMYKARGRSLLPETPVVWKLSNGFIPLDDVELGPPQMEIIIREESLMVHLQIKLIQCKRKVFDACLLKQLTYEVEIWDVNEPVRRPIKQSVRGNSMEIAKHELRGHSNCISARSVYQSLRKFSSFSKPVCFTLDQEERLIEKYLVIMGSALGILFLVSVAAAIVKNIICIPSNVKMPSALDFTRPTTFMQKMADAQTDVCELSIATCFEKSETEICEQNVTLESNLLKEGNLLDNVDDPDESDEENECCNYTDRRWIPDGVMFDKAETSGDTEHQVPIAEGYRKANCFTASTISVTDLQSQGSDCADHRLEHAPQTNLYIPVSNPVSFTSDSFDSKHFNNGIDSIVLDHDEWRSNGDVPLMSVQILCCDGDDTTGDNEDCDPFSSTVPLLDCDLNFQTCDLTYRLPALLPGD
ncbi:interferon lambda receptor 1-like isoform X1 [Stegostoma tigrinum]|uniref:interferon lambda receptor 1-like isoform X1 n=3 Tax=Stegostoma tigrinum TaxID=3053191 RepID=UPI00202B5FA1|nr:interferon lambda receptor 1-like isoform X1 [Stegostoma tigrinum]